MPEHVAVYAAASDPVFLPPPTGATLPPPSAHVPLASSSLPVVRIGFSPFIFLCSIVIWARFWFVISMFSIWLSVLCRIVDGCVIAFGDGMLFVERSRYIGIVLLEDGLDLFFPSMGLSFWPQGMLLAAADLPFRLLVIMLLALNLMSVQPSEDMADVLSTPFTPHSGWAYRASSAVSMFLEPSVGRDYGSWVRI